MIVTIYDLFHTSEGYSFRGLHKVVYAKFMLMTIRKRVSAILTISNFTCNELIKFFCSKSYPPIHIFHLGVSDKWFQGSNGKKPHDKKYILFVGNVKPHKNLTALIDAFSMIATRIPHDLIIVGKKDGFITGDKSAMHFAERLGSRVKFTGYVHDDILLEFFVHADMFVFPSLYEGFGLPPLEAMAAGCPALCSNIVSISEVCGEAALYFDPSNVKDIADQMLSVLNDENLRANLKIRGLVRSKNYSWRSCVDGTCMVLQKFI
jgi:glycosyltransferase involved in cell wall biosynthesis